MFQRVHAFQGRRRFARVLLLALVSAAAAQSPSPYSPSPHSPLPYSSGSSSPSPYSPSPFPSAPGPGPGAAPAPGPGGFYAAAPGGAVNGSGTCSLVYQQSLAPNKPAPAGVGGQGIALASDGSVALLSGSGALGSRAAMAYLFTYYSNVDQYNSCPQEIQDPAPLAGLDWGSAYAMSGDASAILVGAAGRVISGALTGQGQDRAIDGKVYVYKLPSLPGSTRGYSASDAPLAPPSSGAMRNPAFGSAGLAATEGAEFIYVGSPVAPQPTSELASLYGNASVFVFAMSGQNGWSLSQTILAPQGSNNTDFGRKVVSSSTGDVLVVTDPLAEAGPQTCGIFGASPGYVTNGRVYVYRQQPGGSSSQYQLAQTLQGNTNAISGFGADIAMAADGSVLVVGAPEAGSGGRTAHIFNNENGQFVERANVTAPATNATLLARFGQQVALSGDGELLVVHAPLPYVRAYNSPANAQADAVYTFKLARTGANAISAAPAGQLTCPNDQYDPQHTCQDFEQLALSQDGHLLLTSGGFAGPRGTSTTYVYGTQGCVGTAPPSQGA